jgi:ribosomal protein S18 acetylase RimI-like enzyme
MLLEYEPQTEKVKAKAFSKGEKYYYVFFIGTREDAQGRGLASELIRYHQDVVRKSGLPIWLEATTSRSRDLYARLGFEVVGKILLGKGKVGADAKAEVGGIGVPVWGMVWWPAKDVKRVGTPVSEAEGRKNGV